MDRSSEMVCDFPTIPDDEREELDLLYDGILNCYYAPRTNKYYELA